MYYSTSSQLATFDIMLSSHPGKLQNGDRSSLITVFVLCPKTGSPLVPLQGTISLIHAEKTPALSVIFLRI